MAIDREMLLGTEPEHVRPGQGQAWLDARNEQPLPDRPFTGLVDRHDGTIVLTPKAVSSHRSILDTIARFLRT